MNSGQLTQCLLSDLCARCTFRGVFPKDRLPLRVNTRYPSAYVINTARHGGPGEHWVVVWLDRGGRGEYVDSYGLPPFHRDIETFLRRHCARGFHFSPRLLQGVLSMTCGPYCVYYILTKSRGFSVERVLSIFHPYKLWANDRKVLSIVRLV